MPISDTLTTNEVRDSAGTEVEFLRKGGVGSEKIWAKSGEAYNLKHRITLSHQEIGSGIKMRRRSRIRVDKTTMSDVDVTLPITNSAYTVTDTPVGAMSSTTPAKDVLAELGSLIHTLGTSTHLYDGTGLGASALLNGTL